MKWRWKWRLKWIGDENDDEIKENVDKNWKCGGLGGFPPIKIKFIENWNENES